MAGSPSIWYVNYRGAVYPVDFHGDPGLPRTHLLKTLVELAAEKIVQDSNMTREAVSVIPRQLFEPLMKEALLKNRELAIRDIIESWSVPVLKLTDMVPPLFTTVQPSYDLEHMGDIMKQGLRYTTSLAHTFLEALKNKSNTKLRFLDLTGFPTAEVIVYFLATHCMLAHNEVRHETIRNMYEQAVKQTGSKDSGGVEPMEPMEHSLPQDCSVVIKVDAFVTSESTHSELCKALKVSSFHDRKLSIILGRLTLTCLGQARISLLLKQVQPQYMTGLQLQYNALTSHDLVRLVPALKTLVCLESLDLSCNSIFFYQNEEACSAAAEIFKAMPRLHRLDLSNNPIKTRLRRIIDNIVQPLTYLRLAGCSLTVTDLVYLSHSIHCTKLIELDLSENNLSGCERQLQKVITSTRHTLCVLELEDCNLDSLNIHNLLPSLSQLSSVVLTNFSQNRLPRESEVLLVTAFAELQTLKILKFSYATECYSCEEQEDQLKATLLAELNQVLIGSKVQSLKEKPLLLYLTELERILEAV